MSEAGTSQSMFTRRHGSKKPTRQHGCCPCRWSNHQVAPAVGSLPGSDMVKIADGQVLRVRHLNPVHRDAQFESQMKAFIRANHGASTSSMQTNNAEYDPLQNNPSGEIHSPNHKHGISKSRTKSAGPLRTRQSTSNITYNSDTAQQSQSPEKTMENSELHREGTRTASGVHVDLHNQMSSPTPRTARFKAGEDDIEEIPFVQNSGSQNHSLPQNSQTNPAAKNCTLFMFHGVGGSSDVWQAQLDYFEKQGYEIISPDIIGHGFSSAPRDAKAYRFEKIAQDLLYVFDIYCKKTNIVIAHSYGGSFACHLARQRPSLVSGLVLISGGSPTPLSPQPGVFQWPICCLNCCKPLLKSAFGKSAFHMKKTYVPREKAFDVPTYVLKHVMNGQDWPDGNHDYHSLISATSLVIHGQNDGLIAVHDEEEMVLAIQGSELVVVEDASHMVMMEQPVIVNKLIHEFLSQHYKHVR